MRKQYILVLAACLATQVLTAAPVSPERALEIGKMILSSGQAKRSSGNIGIVWDGEFNATRATIDPAFYVVARDGGGFVIIAGDDNVRPVLAISKEDRFETDNMPENVKWWMERIKVCVRSTTTQSTVVRTLWEAFNTTRASAELSNDDVMDKVEHLTPKWDQGNNDNSVFGQQVFNKFCPVDENGLSVTGCVATSLAEVLTTLSEIYPSQMPARSIGKVGGYTVSNGYVAPGVYQLGYYDYDWEHLKELESYKEISNAIADGKTSLLENLGHLMADCGAIMEAFYSSGGTGAYSIYIPRNMAEHFYTSKTARFVKASNYNTTSEWISVLKAELFKHPVLYSGETSEGGHAFVLDGYGLYQESDVFHVNFGWMGACNGYYFLNNLDPKGNNDPFANCDAIFDFFPDAGQTTSFPYDFQFIPHFGTEYGDMIGLSSVSPIVQGEPFTLRIGSLKNTGSQSYSGDILFAIQDKNGDYSRGFFITPNPSPLSPGGEFYTAANISLNISFCFGDKLAALFNDGTNWVPVSYPKDGTIVGELPFTPGAFIKKDSSYSVGDYFDFELMNYDGLYAGTRWAITDPTGTTTTMSQSAGRYQFTQKGKYKIVASIKASADSDIVENVVTFVTVQ